MLYCLSQAPSERQPSGAFATWRVRVLERMMMLTSSMSLETSMPSAGSFMVPVPLPALQHRPASIDLVHRISDKARPRIPYSLKSGARKAGPDLRHWLAAERVDTDSPPSVLFGSA